LPDYLVVARRANARHNRFARCDGAITCSARDHSQQQDLVELIGLPFESINQAHTREALYANQQATSRPVQARAR